MAPIHLAAVILALLMGSCSGGPAEASAVQGPAASLSAFAARRAFRLHEQGVRVEPDDDDERERQSVLVPARPLLKRKAQTGDSLREILGRIRPSNPKKSAQFTPIGVLAESADSDMISDPGPASPPHHHTRYPSSGVTREIAVRQGRLVGVVRTVPGFGEVHQYLGLPYAEPPVGNQRFMPPASPSQWKGLKVADRFGPVCPQNRPDLSLGSMSAGRMSHVQRLLAYLDNQSEDCLYLNVYAPAQLTRSSRLPVMVFIHGESLEWNAGTPYDGSVLAAYGNVIVVTFNFRLGILGFLRPGVDERTVSNFGLLDQVAALQWVKDNIEALGGDPQSVTLMGHSTGAACASLLLVSPVSSNLFKRAILMSGTALADWALTESPLQFTIQVAQDLNCPLSDELALCLRKKRLAELLAVKVVPPAFKTPFGPVVDGSVIPNEPLQLMSTYRELFSRYELLLGVTESEAYHLLDSESLAYGVPEKVRHDILKGYTHARFEQHPDVALARTLAEYAHDPALRHPVAAEGQRDLLLDILSDARVVAPVVHTAELHAVANPSSYLYVFTHRTKAGDYPAVEKSVQGDELAYVFGLPLAPAAVRPDRHFTQQEKILAENVMTLWTNFAKTGNPNIPRKQHPYIYWPEFYPADMAYFNISTNPSVNHQYRSKQMKYWNHDLPEFLRNPQPPLWSEEEESDHGGSWGIPAIYQPRPRDPFAQEEPKPHSRPRVYGKVMTAPIGQGDQRVQPGPVHRTPAPAPAPAPRTELGIRVDGPEEPLESSQHEQAAGVTPSTLALSVVIVVGISFLVVNVCAFGFLYYKKNRLGVEQQFFGSQCRGGGLAEEPGEAYTKKAQSSCVEAGPGAGAGQPEARRGRVRIQDRSREDGIGGRLWDRLLGLLGGATAARHASPGGGGGGGASTSRAGAGRRADSGDDLYEAVRSARSGKSGTARKSALKSKPGTREEGVDAHTKVREWIAQEVVNRCSPGFLGRGRRSLAKTESTDTSLDRASTSASHPGNQSGLRNAVQKVSVAIDATPGTRSSSVLKQVPIELSKSLDGNRLSASMSSPDLSGLPEQPVRRKSTTSISLQPSVVDIAVPQSQAPGPGMQTFSRPQDVNVTSREEGPPAELLGPEEALDNIRRRNFPKVLPDFPEVAPEVSAVQLAAARRRSLPPGQLLRTHPVIPRVPPAPPPRISSTLGRKPAGQVGAGCPQGRVPLEPHAEGVSAPPNVRYEPRLIIRPRDPPVQTSSSSVTLRRPEPRVIIKATSTAPVRPATAAAAHCSDYGTVAEARRARAEPQADVTPPPPPPPAPPPLRPKPALEAQPSACQDDPQQVQHAAEEQKKPPTPPPMPKSPTVSHKRGSSSQNHPKRQNQQKPSSGKDTEAPRAASAVGNSKTGTVKKGKRK